MILKDFIGNEKTVELLGSLLESNRFPHALIIEGDKGLGKKTLARLIAAALVCRNEQRPCMECAQCHKAMTGIHPDIFEHVPSGAANSFHVKVVREVIADAYIKPNEGEHKVYILADCHCMNASSQNALLKVLEEPPEYAVFILTTTTKSALLNTVLSRSTVVALSGVNVNEGVELMCKDSEIDVERARTMLEVFNGNIGRALESINDEKIASLIENAASICNALVDSTEYELIKLASKLQGDRQGYIFTCELLKNIFRDSLLASDTVEYISGQRELANKLKQRLTKDKLIKLIDKCDELKDMALHNANNALLITKICYSLREAVGR